MVIGQKRILRYAQGSPAGSALFSKLRVVSPKRLKPDPSLPLGVSPVDSRYAHAAKTAQFIRDIVTSRINIGDLRHG
jgi:hypothetical protein